MTEEQAKQKAHEYIDNSLSNDPRWLDTISDSWFYDAENWFEDYLNKVEHITIWKNSDEYEYSIEAETLHKIFWDEVLKYKEEKEIEINGIRDGLLMLEDVLYRGSNIETILNKAFKWLDEPSCKNVISFNLKRFRESVECLIGEIEKSQKKQNNVQ